MNASVIIEEVFRRSEQGVLKPFLCRGSDGQTYFVKGQGAGYQGLIAEYVSARLGSALELPIPPFDIVHVPSELVSQSPLEGIWELGSGPAFASSQVPYVQEISASTLVRVPLELQRRVLLFDWWIKNEDRHYSEQYGGNPNLLWNMADNEVVVIDHNLAFDEDFDAAKFWSGHVFRALRVAFSDEQFQFSEKSRLSVVLKHFDAIITELPQEWVENSNFDIDAIRLILNRYQLSEFWDIPP
jgi:hypothetical protein